MNDLITYLMKHLQSGGTSMVPSGSRAVTSPGTSVVPWQPHIIDGQWSEVPKGISGQSQPRLGYIHNGEVEPPVRETFSKPAPRFGPLIEGEAIRPIEAAPGGGLLDGIKGAISRGASGGVGSLAGGTAANPLMAAIMGAVQGDTLNNHKGFFNSPAMQIANRFGAMAPPSPQPTPEQGPAVPAGAVTSSPLPDIQTPNQQVANRFPDMDPAALAKGDRLPMSPNQYVAQNFQQGPHVPMPMARPQMAQSAPTPMPMARPAQAPQAQPDMGFFARNSAMMRDPSTGMFIDPGAAAQAQASNGNIIQKMLGLLHNKANNSD